MRQRFPQMRFTDSESGFIETDTLIAGRGAQAVVIDAGIEAIRAQIGPPRRLPNGDYEVVGRTAHHLVYACGPWLPKLITEVLGGRIFATRQEVLHFGARPGDLRFAAPSLPVWIDSDPKEFAYGFPDLEGQGFKIAFDTHGPEVDPDTQSRQVSAEGVARARDYLKVRFPDLADAPLIHSRVCQYENSSNGDFLIDRLPGHERVWVVDRVAASSTGPQLASASPRTSSILRSVSSRVFLWRRRRRRTEPNGLLMRCSGASLNRFTATVAGNDRCGAGVPVSLTARGLTQAGGLCIPGECAARTMRQQNARVEASKRILFVTALNRPEAAKMKKRTGAGRFFPGMRTLWPGALLTLVVSLPGDGCRQATPPP